MKDLNEWDASDLPALNVTHKYGKPIGRFACQSNGLMLSKWAVLVKNMQKNIKPDFISSRLDSDYRAFSLNAVLLAVVF